ncbi:MAG TPA: aminopeptidase P family N-terminal domain-containing protein, partial [Woeseiaceae bacterium]|nr:aminopeptidase P family N-terminal domain-containing protein [Woeseiaceae bacterium]
MNKRDFLKLGAASGIVSALPASARTGDGSSTAELRDMSVHAQPISAAERMARVAKAQRLMRDAGIGALLLEAGSALAYFTGVRWWRSERFTGALIPADGEIAIVTPYFEEPSVRESLSFGDDVRTWNEHENPFALVAGVLRDRGIKEGRIAVEETVRYFIVDGVRRAAPGHVLVPGEAITRGCRLYKSPAEIALMQLANDITLAAYRH